jgi:hypothetical protein
MSLWKAKLTTVYDFPYGPFQTGVDEDCEVILANDGQIRIGIDTDEVWAGKEESNGHYELSLIGGPGAGATLHRSKKLPTILEGRWSMIVNAQIIKGFWEIRLTNEVNVVDI